MDFRMCFSKRFVKFLAAALGCAAIAPMARGAALEIPNQGARGAGQAEAFGAQADDPSAIYYNPAGIGQLKGTQVSAGLYGLFPEFNFHGSNGTSESMRLPSVLPHFYVTSDFGTEKFHAGFGAFNAFGLNLDWGDKGPLNTLVNKAMLEVMDFSPVVSYNVTDNLTVAVAGDIYYGAVLVERNQMLAAPPVPEGDLRARGYDTSFGVTPALFWKIDEHNTVGAWYRSPFSLDMGGHVRLIDPGVIPQMGPYKSHIHINFPQVVGVAYAWRPVKPWKIEFDGVWTDWDTDGAISLKASNPAFNQTIPARWKSGYSLRLGTQYDLNEHWAVRAGYAFGQQAIPGYTFTPLLPDANYHLFTVGLGYQEKNWSVDAAYQFAYRERRHISNNVASPIVDGAWDNKINTVMVTFTYRM